MRKAQCSSKRPQSLHPKPLLARWLDLLDTRGVDVTDEELLSYISESSMMSKTMEEYDGAQPQRRLCVQKAACLRHMIHQESNCGWAWLLPCFTDPAPCRTQELCYYQDQAPG